MPRVKRNKIYYVFGKGPVSTSDKCEAGPGGNEASGRAAARRRPADDVRREDLACPRWSYPIPRCNVGGSGGIGRRLGVDRGVPGGDRGMGGGKGGRIGGALGWGIGGHRYQSRIILEKLV